MLSVGVSVVLVLCVLALPEPAPTLAPQVARKLPATGVGNPITGVLLAFRALDTLLEAIVLVIALIGVWSLAPDRFWGGRPGLRYTTDPDGILAYLARVLPPIGIVVGIYLFWAGADHPGGKFQSATILAAMWMLVQMAGLADAPRIDSRWVRGGVVIGPLVFVAVGLLGAWTAGAFLGYPDGWAKPMIVAIEMALLPTLVLVLALLLNGAPARGAILRRGAAGDERRDAVRAVRLRAGGHRPVRADHAAAPAAQAGGLQHHGHRACSCSSARWPSAAQPPAWRPTRCRRRCSSPPSLSPSPPPR